MDKIAVFCDTIKQRSGEVKIEFNNIISVFDSMPKEERVLKIKQLFKICESLQIILDDKHCPPWLLAICNVCNNYIQDPAGHGDTLWSTFAKQYNSVQVIDLNSRDFNNLYDLDAMYERAKEQHGIPELFDTIIVILREIIDTKMIDSITVLGSIQQLLDMFSNNRAGSCVAMYQTFRFANIWRAWFRNLAVRLAKRIPIVKEFIEAYEDTLDDLENAFKDVENTVQKLTEDEILKNLPLLDSSDDAAIPLLLSSDEIDDQLE